MNNFDFKNPTRILFGKGQISQLANVIPAGSKVLITYGGGSIKKNGVYEQVIQALEGFEFSEFSGIEPNPTFETLLKAVSLIREKSFDFILAVGGGSIIDGTKFIAAAVKYDGDPWDLLTRKAEVKEALPFGSVLTLPATGSEMNMGAVVSRKETGDKVGLMHPLLYPQFSILDPETTYTLPQRQISNGVLDAFVHTVEQYLTYPVNAKVQDRFSEALLLTLIEEGPKALQNPEDYDTRANIMWAATMALNGLIGSGVPQDWATHMIGHELTAKFGLDHAQTLAVVLPSTLTLMKEQKKEKLVQYAERVWGMTEGSHEEKVNMAIQKTKEFFVSMGVRTRLSEYEVTKEQLPPVIEKLKEHGMVALGEHRNITPEESLKILEMSL